MKMQTAVAWVEINELHDTARIVGLTPAEALIVRSMFGQKVEGQIEPISPITHLDIAEESVERTVAEEYQRLSRKYGEPLIKEAFPGKNPTFPATFDEAGIEATDEKEPKKGKPHKIEPLASLKRGDNGADLAVGADKRQAELEQENMKLRLELLEHKSNATPRAASASAETVVQIPPPPPVPPAENDAPLLDD